MKCIVRTSKGQAGTYCPFVEDVEFVSISDAKKYIKSVEEDSFCNPPDNSYSWRTYIIEVGDFSKRVRQVRDALNKCKNLETIEQIASILKV